MILERKKVENCFAGSRTYEYRIPCSGEELASALPEGWEARRNERLRRPVFVAQCPGIHIKGMLAGNTVRASFREQEWEALQQQFEHWLEHVTEDFHGQGDSGRHERLPRVPEAAESAQDRGR